MKDDTSSSWNAILIAPRIVLRGDADGACLFRDHRNVKSWKDPLAALAWLSTSWQELDLPRADRWIGYLSSGLGRRFERLPSLVRDVLHAPLFQFGMSSTGR